MSNPELLHGGRASVSGDGYWTVGGASVRECLLTKNPERRFYDRLSNGKVPVMGSRSALVVASLLAASVFASMTQAAPQAARSSTVSWIYRHEARGEALAAANIRQTALVGAHWQPVRFARVVAPRKFLGGKIAVSLIGRRGLNLCMTAFVGRSSFGGCGLGHLHPMKFSLASHSGPSAVIAGLAADDVARITLVPARGKPVSVPLVDNAFLARVSKADVPGKLVSYGRDGRSLGSAPVRPLASMR